MAWRSEKPRPEVPTWFWYQHRLDEPPFPVCVFLMRDNETYEYRVKGGKLDYQDHTGFWGDAIEAPEPKMKL